MTNSEMDGNILYFETPEVPTSQKGPDDEKIERFIYEIISELDTDLLIRLSSLPPSKREDLKKEVALFAHTQMVNLAILQSNSNPKKFHFEEVRKITNFFSREILLKMVDIYLKYKLSLMSEPVKERILPGMSKVTQKSLKFLTEESSDPIILEITKKLINLDQDVFFRILDSVQKSVSADLVDFQKLCTRPENMSIDLFVKLIQVILTPLSKILLMTRLELELYCLEESRPKYDGVTRLMKMPSTNELIEEIKLHWENNLSQNIFMFRTSSLTESEHLQYIDEIAKLKNIFLEGKVRFIRLSESRTLLTITGEKDLNSLVSFVENLETMEINKVYKPKVSFTFLDPPLYDNKWLNYKGEFDTFISEVVIDTLYRHLGEGMEKAFSIKDKEFVLACGYDEIDSSDFEPQKMQYLSKTRISWQEDLSGATHIVRNPPKYPEIQPGEATNPQIPSRLKAKKRDEITLVDPSTEERARTMYLHTEDKEKPIKISDYHVTEETRVINAGDLIRGLQDTNRLSENNRATSIVRNKPFIEEDSMVIVDIDIDISAISESDKDTISEEERIILANE